MLYLSRKFYKIKHQIHEYSVAESGTLYQCQIHATRKKAMIANIALEQKTNLPNVVFNFHTAKKKA